MKFFKILFFIVVTTFLLGACASKSVGLNSSEVMAKHQSIKELNRLLINAKNSDTNTLAPEGFDEASELYKKAFERASEQKPGADGLAQQGIEEIRTAMQDAKTSESIMKAVLDARNKAIIAKALILFPDDFGKLEERLRDAMVALEDKKVEQAKQMRARLIKNYADIELRSLKTTITEQAKESIAQAREMDADNDAPKTFKLAEEELALAIDVLDAGRTQVDKAKDHADLSVFYAQKSIQIKQIVSDFEREDFSEEDKILWYQQQLETINQPFDQSLPLDKPNVMVVNGIQDQISTLQQSKLEREKALYAANEKIESLQQNIQTMGSKYQQEVAGLNQKIKGNDASARKEMERIRQENIRAEARYKKIQNMFSEQEARVFRQGNNVLLETHAFNFKVGGSEIDSSNYDLLDKIVEAIKVFDNPDIMIMGHTDSTGSDALNLNLSQKRAATVTSFLKKVVKFSPDRISTRGYGESRPVASNETREGRKRNRRIEVLIINK